MNVLSLFDGCSGGQQALERANIKVSQYFASEIDKYAIKVTMANYPDTIQLGSVVNVKGTDLPKIDMLIGGSPCQSFSFAGKRKGMATKCNQEILTLEQYLELKEQGFEFEGQSYLFWEYVRVLNEVKPKYFLLENVMMEERWEKIISKTLGVHPVEINSSLLSAQNRKRLYWTNIGLKPSGLFGDLESIIKQPNDKGILLKDILEYEVDNKYFLSEKIINGMYGNKILNTNIEKHKNELEHGTLLDSYNQVIHKDKSITVSTRIDASNCTHIVHNLQHRSGDPKKDATGHLSKSDGKTYCLDTGNCQAVEILLKYPKLEQNKSNNNNILFNRKGFKTNTQVFGIHGKCGTLDTSQGGGREKYTLINSKIRRLTPIECERLQTVKDNYTNHVSDSQRYKMLGNGWTVDVIAYIFGYIE